MLWMKNKENSFQMRTLIWRPAESMPCYVKIIQKNFVFETNWPITFGLICVKVCSNDGPKFILNL